MPTINLLPNGTSSNNWTLSTGLAANLLLDEDFGGSIGVDASRLTATSGGADVIVSMDDFTEDFFKINSVQLVTRAGNNVRSTTFSLHTRLMNGTAGDFMMSTQELKQHLLAIGHRHIQKEQQVMALLDGLILI